MEVSHKPLWGTASLNNSEAAAGCSSDSTVTISSGSARIVPLDRTSSDRPRISNSRSLVMLRRAVGINTGKPGLQLVALYALGCFWGQADINRQAKPAGSVENDPSRTSER